MLSVYKILFHQCKGNFAQFSPLLKLLLTRYDRRMNTQSKSPQYLDSAFEAVSQELLEMFLKKHKDYGKGNILANEELGIAMRVSEKVERLKHLFKTGATPTNEQIEETWIDIGVYSVIAVLFRRGWFQSLEVAEERK